MNDRHLSCSTAAANVLWFIAAGTLSAAWIVMSAAPNAWRYAGLLAATSAVVSGAAATASIRVYALRSHDLTRALAGIDVPHQRKSLESVK